MNRQHRCYKNARQYAYEVEGMPMFYMLMKKEEGLQEFANNPKLLGNLSWGAMQYIGSAIEAYQAGRQLGAYLNELDLI